MVAVPLGLIAWLGVRTARQEQERVQQRMQSALLARLADLRDGVGRLLEKDERELQRLTEVPEADADALRAVVRGQRLVRQMFVLSPDRSFIFPPPDGAN